MIHVCITSVQFDTGPEGVCTGRLIRALLDAGFKVTLLTSSKARLGFEHPHFSVYVFSHRPREPRVLLRWFARLGGHFVHNFYVWGRKVSRFHFPSDSLPDLFYGRAWPISSLIPAYHLARRYDKPLISHLSDPVPPPNEPPATAGTLADLQRLVDHSKFVTFTNVETIDYQRRFLRLPEGKAALLPHVAPGVTRLTTNYDNNAFYYIGAIGNREEVLKAVLRAFSCFHRECAEARLHFVTDRPSRVEALSRSLELQAVPIHVGPYAPSFREAVEPAGVFISFEPQVDTPIWTLTKMIEYLLTNRKILAVASPGSVTQSLMERFPESCVVVTDYSPEAIAKGFGQVARLRPSETHFNARFAAMADYRGDQVAVRFQGICEQLLLR